MEEEAAVEAAVPTEEEPEETGALD
jgi:hypothetical protein